ncbi:porin family protein [Sulfurimonas sp. HSL3-7]|uniref:porin family protein n=1 Tax=Sulfonitrofixus jiaomeiensis TaxID=3131938 RepID=UPI0031F7B80A
MKKLTTALLTAGLLSSAAVAAEVGFYAGGGLAFEAVPDYKDLKMGLGVVVRGGMTLDSVLEHFAIEGEVTKSIVDPKYDLPGKDVKFNVNTLAAYAVYRIPVADKFYVKPRFGIIIPNLGDDINSRDVTFSSGIGGGYTVMPHLDVYVDYTVLGEFVTNYGAGVEYHF